MTVLAAVAPCLSFSCDLLSLISTGNSQSAGGTFVLKLSNIKNNNFWSGEHTFGTFVIFNNFHSMELYETFTVLLEEYRRIFHVLGLLSGSKSTTTTFDLLRMVSCPSVGPSNLKIMVNIFFFKIGPLVNKNIHLIFHWHFFFFLVFAGITLRHKHPKHKTV